MKGMAYSVHILIVGSEIFPKVTVFFFLRQLKTVPLFTSYVY